MLKRRTTTSKVLKEVVDTISADRISVGDLMKSMDVGGFGLVMTIFSLPIIVPLPPPLPSLIAIPLLMFSMQLILGFGAPKLPKRLANYSIKRSILAKIVEKASPYLLKAESIVKPRLLILSSALSHRILGIFCFIFAISIAVPIPLSNLIPGIGVLITSFGLLGRDGFLIALGVTVGCFGVLVTIATLLMGVEAIKIFFGFLNL